MRNRRTLTRRRALTAAASLVALAACTLPPATQGATTVSIGGTRFLVNGRPTNEGSPAEGLLLNSRMIQAVFDDENPATVGNWRYPDTRRWDARRNTREFVAALPAYAARGLDAVTVGLQGGNPVPGTGSQANQTWNVSAYNADGSLKPAWLARLRRVLAAADANRMVVIVSLFYQAQDERLRDEAAVRRATTNVVRWLLRQRHRNVLVEIANESDNRGFDHAILKPGRVDELIRLAQSSSGGRYAVSTSFNGGSLPPQSVIQAADFALVHGNGQEPGRIRRMVAALEGGTAKPIVFNEDSTDLEKLDAAVAAGASWGYHDKGRNNYADGFQCPPVNWAINTASKRAFFAQVSSLTRAAQAGAAVRREPPLPRPRLVVKPLGLRAKTIRGTVRWAAKVTGAKSARVEFLIDGDLRWTERESPYVFNGDRRRWNTTRELNGQHTLTTRVIAADGRIVRKRMRVTVKGGIKAGFAAAPRLRGRAVVVRANTPPRRVVAIEIYGPTGTLLGRDHARAGPDGRAVKRVALSRWRGKRPMRARISLRVSGEVRRGSTEVALPDLVLLDRPKIAGKRLRVRASAVPGSRVWIEVRGLDGRVLGLARTHAGKAGRIRTRVALPLWDGEGRLRVSLRASVAERGRREQGRARMVVRLSPRAFALD